MTALNPVKFAMFGTTAIKPANECEWCGEPSTELRVWTAGGWVKDHICKDCFALHDGENDYTDLTPVELGEVAA